MLNVKIVMGLDILKEKQKTKFDLHQRPWFRFFTPMENFFSKWVNLTCPKIFAIIYIEKQKEQLKK